MELLPRFQKVHGNIAIRNMIRLAKPHPHGMSTTTDLPHHLNLMILFMYIRLVDTERIDPKSYVLILRAHLI
jgi:hypothetical protein